METYEIHNREVLLEAMATCAGPDCGTACPYKDKSGGGKSCRMVLLEAAMAALTKDKDDLDALEAAARTFREERDSLKEYALVVEKEGQEARAERDALFQERLALLEDRGTLGAQNEKLRAERDDLRASCRVQQDRLIEERDAFGKECAALTAENKTLHERCTVLQNEINALALKLGKQDSKTDRPSVEDKELMAEVCKMICEAKYQEGRADTLAEIVARCSFGGGGRHE